MPEKQVHILHVGLIFIYRIEFVELPIDWNILICHYSVIFN